MASDQVVRVFALGLDARFRSMLDVFFARSGEGGYEFSESLADLIVVDIDAAGAREAFSEHRQEHKKMPCILFSLGEDEYRTRGNVIQLRKPFTVRQLQSAFEIVTIRFLRRKRFAVNPQFGENIAVTQQPAKQANEASKEQHRQNEIATAAGKEIAANASTKTKTVTAFRSKKSCESTGIKPAPVKNREQAGTSRAAFSLAKQVEYVKLNSTLPGAESSDEENETKEFQPDHYFLGKLKSSCQEALKRNKNVVIKLGGGTITIDPAQGMVLMGMGEYQLREGSSFLLNNDTYKASLVSEQEAPVDESGERKVVSLRVLLWETALFASRGRVPAGTDMDAPVKLKRWPNLTRLLLMPDAVRMSAFWTDEPISINGLVKQLGLAEGDVYSFYSAAHALDLFDSGEEIKPEKIETKRKPRSGGIFKRILKRLRTFS